MRITRPVKPSCLRVSAQLAPPAPENDVCIVIVVAINELYLSIVFQPSFPLGTSAKGMAMAEKPPSLPIQTLLDSSIPLPLSATFSCGFFFSLSLTVGASRLLMDAQVDLPLACYLAWVLDFL